MAYITKEEVSVIRENLKREFPAFRFTLSGGNSSKLNVVIKSGPIRFIPEPTAEEAAKGWVCTDINHYHITNYVYKEVLQKIIDVCLEKHWDTSDAQSDYFNCAFYFSIHQGTWDKPYQIAKPSIHTTQFYLEN